MKASYLLPRTWTLAFPASEEKGDSCSDARDAFWEILENLRELVNPLCKCHLSWSGCGALSQGHWIQS